jgi:hypothetical protein
MESSNQSRLTPNASGFATNSISSLRGLMIDTTATSMPGDRLMVLEALAEKGSVNGEAPVCGETGDIVTGLDRHRLGPRLQAPLFRNSALRAATRAGPGWDRSSFDRPRPRTGPPVGGLSGPRASCAIFWRAVMSWGLAILPLGLPKGYLIRPTAVPANPRKTPGGIIPLWRRDHLGIGRRHHPVTGRRHYHGIGSGFLRNQQVGLPAATGASASSPTRRSLGM